MILLPYLASLWNICIVGSKSNDVNYVPLLTELESDANFIGNVMIKTIWNMKTIHFSFTLRFLAIIREIITWACVM